MSGEKQTGATRNRAGAIACGALPPAGPTAASYWRHGASATPLAAQFSPAIASPAIARAGIGCINPRSRLKNVPQGLKPQALRARCGTTEVVPFHGSIYAASYRKPTEPQPDRTFQFQESEP
jgi:hypothetical protein